MKIIEGNIAGLQLKPAIVAGRFNAFIVDHLVNGAADAFARSGTDTDAITVYRAPGSFEIPQVLRRVVESSKHDCVVCVGAVIRGGTPHFEYVASSVTRGITQIAGTSPIPVTFGVLTTDTVEQAIERAGTKAGNKGFEAAMAAIEMVALLRRMG